MVALCWCAQSIHPAAATAKSRAAAKPPRAMMIARF